MTICATSEDSQQSEEGTEMEKKQKQKKKTRDFFTKGKVYLKIYI